MSERTPKTKTVTDANGFDGDYVRYIASAGMKSDIDPSGDFRTFHHILFLTLQQMAQRIIALEGDADDR